MGARSDRDHSSPLIQIKASSGKVAPQQAPEISILTEIVFLFIIAVLHSTLPQVAGTLGLSFISVTPIVIVLLLCGLTAAVE